MSLYFETVPANQVEAMLWAHAERMGRSVLDQQVFETERNIVQEEMRQRVLSQPYGRLQRYYSFDKVMPLLMPLLLLNLGLVVLGSWLIYRSIRRIHHYEHRIRELCEKYREIGQFVE